MPSPGRQWKSLVDLRCAMEVDDVFALSVHECACKETKVGPLARRFISHEEGQSCQEAVSAGVILTAKVSDNSECMSVSMGNRPSAVRTTNPRSAAIGAGRDRSGGRNVVHG